MTDTILDRSPRLLASSNETLSRVQVPTSSVGPCLQLYLVVDHPLGCNRMLFTVRGDGSIPCGIARARTAESLLADIKQPARSRRRAARQGRRGQRRDSKTHRWVFLEQLFQNMVIDPFHETKQTTLWFAAALWEKTLVAKRVGERREHQTSRRNVVPCCKRRLPDCFSTIRRGARRVFSSRHHSTFWPSWKQHRRSGFVRHIRGPKIESPFPVLQTPSRRQAMLA